MHLLKIFTIYVHNREDLFDSQGCQEEFRWVKCISEREMRHETRTEQQAERENLRDSESEKLRDNRQQRERERCRDCCSFI